MDDQYVVDFLTEGWAEEMADRMLEQLHRQKDPVLRRRYVARQLRLLALKSVCEAVEVVQEGREHEADD